MSRYDIASYYCPGFHEDPRWHVFSPHPLGEWESVRTAVPKFPGHHQPRVPLWGYEDETDPRVMERKIDAAADHGMNVFIFDWYWYENQPYLEGCLNNGFLKAGNVDRVKFYLMWANHDASTMWSFDRSHDYQVIWPGAADRAAFDAVADRVIERFMTHPSYYKIDGKPVFQIYETSTLLKGLGGIGPARDALDSFRRKVERAGFPGLHLQAILWGEMPASISGVPGDSSRTQDHTVRTLGYDSLTNYQWCHYVHPEGHYADWARQAMARWDQWAAEFSVPYYPHVSLNWDNNPRFKARQICIDDASPDQFADCLRQAKAFVDQRSDLAPKLITINAWNEWTEGCNLEPETRYGMGNLEAIRDVFGSGR